MAPVAVVADTCHYLPRDLVERLGIGTVSLHVKLPDGTLRRESDFIDYGEYYSILGSTSELPTTSQPSVGDFLSVWEPLLEEGREIVSVHISGMLSGTVETAQMAKQELGDRGQRVEVVDSRSGAGGEALVVLGAVAAAQSGKNAKDCADHANATRERMRMWFAVDTLEYFLKGGRIGRANAWVGTALKIKPILTIEEEITPVERVRTSARAFAKMVDYLKSLAEDGQDGWLVQHIRNPDQAEALAEEGRAIFGNEPLCISEVGPVMGTYSGPGLLGVGGAPRDMLQAD
ncbi:MAG: DegV family protein [Solirubrobacterales bacterium]|nr:DegV family protein [Solirubrobacterales bacterium]